MMPQLELSYHSTPTKMSFMPHTDVYPITKPTPATVLSPSPTDDKLVGFSERKKHFDSTTAGLLGLHFAEANLEHRQLVELLVKQVHILGWKYAEKVHYFGAVNALSERFTQLADLLCERLLPDVQTNGIIPTQNVRLLYRVIDEGSIILGHFGRIRLNWLDAWNIEEKGKIDIVEEVLSHLTWRLINLVNIFEEPELNAKKSWQKVISAMWKDDIEKRHRVTKPAPALADYYQYAEYCVVQ
ncbi:hypothetical protein, variant [Cryptococcus amylolentus CBS 6039]|nr:hypothetical protein, variant [Cryptococcus amylolentus CBS 6039]ODN76536.1 hypothetical protein, variant [Cryptococcus amylolentus CBS 6039]